MRSEVVVIFSPLLWLVKYHDNGTQYTSKVSSSYSDRVRLGYITSTLICFKDLQDENKHLRRLRVFFLFRFPHLNDSPVIGNCI